MIVQPLIDGIEHLLQLHRDLLTLAKQKKGILIQGDMTALQQLLKEEEQLVRKVQVAEKERIDKGQEVAEKLAIPLQDLTLSKLLDMAKGNPLLQARLQQIDKEFPTIVQHLQQQNQQNGQLIEQSLQFIEQTLDLIIHNDPDEPAHVSRSFFDTKI